MSNKRFGSWFDGLNTAPTQWNHSACWVMEDASIWNVSVWEPNGSYPKLKRERARSFFHQTTTTYLPTTFHLSLSLCLCQSRSLLLICSTRTLQSFHCYYFFFPVSIFSLLWGFSCIFFSFTAYQLPLCVCVLQELAYLFIGVETMTRNASRLLCIQSTWK